MSSKSCHGRTRSIASDVWGKTRDGKNVGKTENYVESRLEKEKILWPG